MVPVDGEETKKKIRGTLCTEGQRWCFPIQAEGMEEGTAKNLGAEQRRPDTEDRGQELGYPWRNPSS